jgi:hypothetical protein
MESEIQAPAPRRITRRHYTPEQIEQYLAAQPSSGLTIAAFCQQNGVAPSVFYGWKRGRMKPGKPTSCFREVILPDLLTSSWVAEIALPNGAVLRLGEAADLLRLRVWLTQLLRS